MKAKIDRAKLFGVLQNGMQERGYTQTNELYPRPHFAIRSPNGKVFATGITASGAWDAAINKSRRRRVI